MLALLHDVIGRETAGTNPGTKREQLARKIALKSREIISLIEKRRKVPHNAMKKLMFLVNSFFEKPAEKPVEDKAPDPGAHPPGHPTRNCTGSDCFEDVKHCDIHERIQGLARHLKKYVQNRKEVELIDRSKKNWVRRAVPLKRRSIFWKNSFVSGRSYLCF